MPTRTPSPLLDATLNVTIPTITSNGVTARPVVSDIAMPPGASYSYNGTTGVLAFTFTTPGSEESVGPFESRAVSFNMSVRRGFESGTEIAVSAVASGRDRYCGPTTGSATAKTVLRAEPALYVAKTVNYTIAGPGTELIYDITYQNQGDAIARNTWIMDLLPEAVDLAWLEVPANVTEVRLSNAAVLPPYVSDEVDLRTFLPLFSATSTPNPTTRRVSWTVANPRWIAWRVDDSAYTPPLLVTGAARGLRFGVTVKPTAQPNVIANNDVATFADELLQTVGERAVTIISALPSVRVGSTCGARVLAGGEGSTIEILYYNDATNPATAMTIDVDLGAGHLYQSHTHTWNALTAPSRGATTITHLAPTSPSTMHRFVITSPKRWRAPALGRAAAGRGHAPARDDLWLHPGGRLGRALVQGEARSHRPGSVAPQLRGGDDHAHRRRPEQQRRVRRHQDPAARPRDYQARAGDSAAGRARDLHDHLPQPQPGAGDRRLLHRSPAALATASFTLIGDEIDDTILLQASWPATRVIGDLLGGPQSATIDCLEETLCNGATLDLGRLPLGAYVLEVRIVDVAGNVTLIDFHFVVEALHAGSVRRSTRISVWAGARPGWTSPAAASSRRAAATSEAPLPAPASTRPVIRRTNRCRSASSIAAPGKK